ncbi:MAG: hypothetical protein EBT03_10480 [Betaproteobacteria bacterium]|nr:hypothetical protein [Betaproteobacteria bacterium]NCA17841.1 hypothetical protein [Betaproteobacteria bacterium]
MPRKSATEPRRLYNRNGSTFVLFEGRYYAAPVTSAVAATGQPVVCAKLPSDGGRSRIEAAVGETKEVWRSFKLEMKHRAKPTVVSAVAEELPAAE